MTKIAVKVEMSNKAAYPQHANRHTVIEIVVINVKQQQQKCNYQIISLYAIPVYVSLC